MATQPKSFQVKNEWAEDGARLRRAIGNNGMTQEKFAELMRVPASTVSRWCNGRMAFDRIGLRRRASLVLGCSMEILDGTTAPLPLALAV